MYASLYSEGLAEERRRDIAAAFENFEADMIGALLHDIHRELNTPAWRKPVARTQVPEAVSSLMDKHLMAPLLEVLQGAAKSSDVVLKTKALTVIRDIARAHADTHAEAA